VIDTHCHLDVAAFDADRAAVLARAAAVGVTGVLVPAIRPATWSGLVDLARMSALVRIGFGVHPQAVRELGPGEVSENLTEQIVNATVAAGRFAVAVGECGLDGPTGDQAVQEQLFRAHIRAARELGKPLLIHVLRAHDVAPRILREERAHEVGGVMHSYSGSPDLVGVYRDLGMAFSFAGPITYPNAKKPLAAARVVPTDLLLADAPDQVPAAHRGQRSEPSFVVDVIAGLAAACDTLPARMAELTTANARRLFGDFAIDTPGH
jgi:TatD DNase family protein